MLNFREENFRDQKANHEIHENIVPRKFGAILYFTQMCVCVCVCVSVCVCLSGRNNLPRLLAPTSVIVPTENT